MTATRFPRHGLSMSNGSNSDGRTQVWFDHIEVHVHEVIACGDFLQRLLRWGRTRPITDDGIHMFIATDGTRIEVKPLAPAAAGGGREAAKDVAL